MILLDYFCAYFDSAVISMCFPELSKYHRAAIFLCESVDVVSSSHGTFSRSVKDFHRNVYVFTKTDLCWGFCALCG